MKYAINEYVTRYVAELPAPSELDPGVVAVECVEGAPAFAMFACPCGCDSPYVLALVSEATEAVGRPKWHLRSLDGQPATLHPSVARRGGCGSHFFITDGRVR